MHKPGRLFVAALSLPFLVGCFTLVETPIPASPQEREALALRGVVVRDGERVEFEEVYNVQWTNDQLFVVARERGIDGFEDATRQFPLASLSGILVREVDAGKTSGIIGGAIVGTIIVVALIVTGSDPRIR